MVIKNSAELIAIALAQPLEIGHILSFSQNMAIRLIGIDDAHGSYQFAFGECDGRQFITCPAKVALQIMRERMDEGYPGFQYYISLLGGSVTENTHNGKNRIEVRLAIYDVNALAALFEKYGNGSNRKANTKVQIEQKEDRTIFKIKDVAIEVMGTPEYEIY